MHTAMLNTYYYIIGGSIGAAVVVCAGLILVTICAAIFLVRRRRQRASANNATNNNATTVTSEVEVEDKQPEDVGTSPDPLVPSPSEEEHVQLLKQNSGLPLIGNEHRRKKAPLPKRSSQKGYAALDDEEENSNSDVDEFDDLIGNKEEEKIPKEAYTEISSPSTPEFNQEKVEEPSEEVRVKQVAASEGAARPERAEDITEKIEIHALHAEVRRAKDTIDFSLALEHTSSISALVKAKAQQRKTQHSFEQVLAMQSFLQTKKAVAKYHSLLDSSQSLQNLQRKNNDTKNYLAMLVSAIAMQSVMRITSFLKSVKNIASELQAVARGHIDTQHTSERMNRTSMNAIRLQQDARRNNNYDELFNVKQITVSLQGLAGSKEAQEKCEQIKSTKKELSRLHTAKKEQQMMQDTQGAADLLQAEGRASTVRESFEQLSQHATAIESIARKMKYAGDFKQETEKQAAAEHLQNISRTNVEETDLMRLKQAVQALQSTGNTSIQHLRVMKTSESSLIMQQLARSRQKITEQVLVASTTTNLTPFLTTKEVSENWKELAASSTVLQSLSAATSEKSKHTTLVEGVKDLNSLARTLEDEFDTIRSSSIDVQSASSGKKLEDQMHALREAATSLTGIQTAKRSVEDIKQLSQSEQLLSSLLNAKDFRYTAENILHLETLLRSDSTDFMSAVAAATILQQKLREKTDMQVMLNLIDAQVEMATIMKRNLMQLRYQLMQDEAFSQKEDASEKLQALLRSSNDVNKLVQNLRALTSIQAALRTCNAVDELEQARCLQLPSLYLAAESKRDIENIAVAQYSLHADIKRAEFLETVSKVTRAQAIGKTVGDLVLINSKRDIVNTAVTALAVHDMHWTRHHSTTVQASARTSAVVISFRNVADIALMLQSQCRSSDSIQEFQKLSYPSSTLQLHLLQNVRSAAITLQRQSRSKVLNDTFICTAQTSIVLQQSQRRQTQLARIEDLRTAELNLSTITKAAHSKLAMSQLQQYLSEVNSYLIHSRIEAARKHASSLSSVVRSVDAVQRMKSIGGTSELLEASIRNELESSLRRLLNLLNSYQYQVQIRQSSAASRQVQSQVRKQQARLHFEEVSDMSLIVESTLRQKSSVNLMHSTRQHTISLQGMIRSKRDSDEFCVLVRCCRNVGSLYLHSSLQHYLCELESCMPEVQAFARQYWTKKYKFVNDEVVVNIQSLMRIDIEKDYNQQRNKATFHAANLYQSTTEQLSFADLVEKATLLASLVRRERLPDVEPSQAMLRTTKARKMWLQHSCAVESLQNIIRRSQSTTSFDEAKVSSTTLQSSCRTQVECSMLIPARNTVTMAKSVHAANTMRSMILSTYTLVQATEQHTYENLACASTRLHAFSRCNNDETSIQLLKLTSTMLQAFGRVVLTSSEFLDTKREVVVLQSEVISRPVCYQHHEIQMQALVAQSALHQKYSQTVVDEARLTSTELNSMSRFALEQENMARTKEASTDLESQARLAKTKKAYDDEVLQISLCQSELRSKTEFLRMTSLNEQCEVLEAYARSSVATLCHAETTRAAGQLHAKLVWLQNSSVRDCATYLESLARMSEQKFLDLSSKVTSIQSFARCLAAVFENQSYQQADILLQSAARSSQEFIKFITLGESATFAAASMRAIDCSSSFDTLKQTSIVLESAVRLNQHALVERQVVLIPQSNLRSKESMNSFSAIKGASVVMEVTVGQTKLVSEFATLRSTVIELQSASRAAQIRLLRDIQFAALICQSMARLTRLDVIDPAVVLQSRSKSNVVMRDMSSIRCTATELQSACEHEKLQLVRKSARALQAKANCARNTNTFQEVRQLSSTLQSANRTNVKMEMLSHLTSATTKLQKAHRATNAEAEFAVFSRNSRYLQSALMAIYSKDSMESVKLAVISTQQLSRVLSLNAVRDACTSLQSAARQSKEDLSYMVSHAVVLQSFTRKNNDFVDLSLITPIEDISRSIHYQHRLREVAFACKEVQSQSRSITIKEEHAKNVKSAIALQSLLRKNYRGSSEINFSDLKDIEHIQAIARASMAVQAFAAVQLIVTPAQSVARTTNLPCRAACRTMHSMINAKTQQEDVARITHLSSLLASEVRAGSARQNLAEAVQSSILVQCVVRIQEPKVRQFALRNAKSSMGTILTCTAEVNNFATLQQAAVQQQSLARRSSITDIVNAAVSIQQLARMQNQLNNALPTAAVTISQTYYRKQKEMEVLSLVQGVGKDLQSYVLKTKHQDEMLAIITTAPVVQAIVRQQNQTKLPSQSMSAVYRSTEASTSFAALSQAIIVCETIAFSNLFKVQIQDAIDAAKVLQALHQGRNENLSAVITSALTLQSLHRSGNSQTQIDHCKQAACTLQSAVLTSIQQTKHNNSIVIQATARYWLARRDLKNKKRALELKKQIESIEQALVAEEVRDVSKNRQSVSAVTSGEKKEALSEQRIMRLVSTFDQQQREITKTKVKNPIIRQSIETKSPELILKDQGIESLPYSLTECQHVTKLDLSGNNLTEIPEWFSNTFTKLTHLSLSGNNLRALPEHLEKLKHLEEIDISGNKLEFFPEPLLKLGASVKKIDISSNTLVNVPNNINQLVNLQELDLSDNNLMKLPEELGKLKKLKKTHIQGNQFLQSELGNVARIVTVNLDKAEQAKVLGAIRKGDHLGYKTSTLKKAKSRHHLKNRLPPGVPSYLLDEVTDTSGFSETDFTENITDMTEFQSYISEDDDEEVAEEYEEEDELSDDTDITSSSPPNQTMSSPSTPFLPFPPKGIPIESAPATPSTGADLLDSPTPSTPRSRPEFVPKIYVVPAQAVRERYMDEPSATSGSTSRSEYEIVEELVPISDRAILSDRGMPNTSPERELQSKTSPKSEQPESPKSETLTPRNMTTEQEATSTGRKFVDLSEHVKVEPKTIQKVGIVETTETQEPSKEEKQEEKVAPIKQQPTVVQPAEENPLPVAPPSTLTVPTTPTTPQMAIVGLEEKIPEVEIPITTTENQEPATGTITQKTQTHKVVKKIVKKKSVVIQKQNAENRKSVREPGDSEETKKKLQKLISDRFSALMEIIESEKKYCSFLDILWKVYHIPITEQGAKGEKGKATLPNNIKDTLFPPGLNAIIQFNKSLLAQLEKRFALYRTNNSLPETMYFMMLGDIFINCASQLQVYINYVVEYEKAMGNIRQAKKSHPKFETWLDDLKRAPQSNGQDLGSLLIMPVQRVPRYLLLLKALVSKTEVDHPDYENLVVAIEKINEYATYQNAQIAEFNNKMKVQQLGQKFKLKDLSTETRKLIREGELKFYETKKTCKAYLFSDLLLIHKVKGKVIKRNIIKQYPLQDAFISGSGSDTLTIVHPKKTLNFYFTSNDDHLIWYKDFSAALEKLNQSGATRRPSFGSAPNSGSARSSKRLSFGAVQDFLKKLTPRTQQKK